MSVNLHQKRGGNEMQHIETVNLRNVRRSTTSNKIASPKRLSYLAKTEAVPELSTWDNIARMPAKEAEKGEKAEEEETESLIKNQMCPHYYYYLLDLQNYRQGRS